MYYYLGLLCVILTSYVTFTDGACTMPEELRGSSWVDNVKGDITFGTWKLSGWSFVVNGQNVSQWEIVDNVYYQSEGYLALRSLETFDVSSTTYYSYLCMKFEKISNDVYKYYLPQGQEPLADNNNVVVANHDDLTNFDEVCNRTYPIDQKIFNVLVKSGQRPSFTCPNPILATFHFEVALPNGTVACSPANTDWEACGNKRVLQLNNTCSYPVAYSDSGRLNCIASHKDGDTTSVMLMNTDDTVDSTDTFRFSCAMVKDDGKSMVITPRECFPGQTYSDFPNNRNGDKVGQRVSTTELSSDCRIRPADDDDDPVLSVPEIVGIVLGALVLIVIIIVVLYCFCCKRG